MTFLNLAGWCYIPKNNEAPTIFWKKGNSKGAIALLKE